MKKSLGKTKVGKVEIGDNVFVGAYTVILPGVKVGDNVVIAANSTVTKHIPAGEVWGGNPAKYIMSIEQFLEKHHRNMKNHTVRKCNAIEVLKTEKFVYVD